MQSLQKFACFLRTDHPERKEFTHIIYVGMQTAKVQKPCRCACSKITYLRSFDKKLEIGK